MADERIYREDEVEEIFALAAREGSAGVRAPSEGDGLTLGQLQEVGREVGLAPERVAEAAASLDARPAQLPRQTLLGSPVSVGRIVELPRAPTDREWQFLVAELRETFGAQGRVTAHGDVREWSNGNLHAALEQTESGHRLRLGTRKGNAIEAAAGGAVGIGMALFFGVALLAAGKPEAVFLPILFALMGGSALAWNALRLPRWADEREEQMERIGARARQLLTSPPQA
ncbi:MAG: hypothetical protein R3266_07140 [Gemmatimonadota bacterium]|nr:hypothetical protein [Gemmatimonadota bacterium]